MNKKIFRLLEEKEQNYIFPFLWLHGEEEQVLRDYMQAIKNAHIRAVCVESRPHPDFAGPGWWHDMDIILDEARKREMKVWILDDSHFPTGYANGAAEDAEEELCRQSLAYRVFECHESQKVLKLTPDMYQKVPQWQPNLNESYTMKLEEIRHFEDDQMISAAAVKSGGISEKDIIDLTTMAKNGEICFTVPEGRWKIYICYLTRNRGPHRNYINMMNAASCRLLLDAVYEPHYEHYADDFGKTIAGFFSDEPELGNGHLYESGKQIHELEDQAWSADIQTVLQQKWGRSFAKYLPLLWEQQFADEIKAKVRYDYMDAVTRAVERSFSMQIGGWCREHGVEYIGHLIEDDNQHTRTAGSLGHYFRGLAGQDMAGIDNIGSQVLPQGEWIGPYGIMNEQRNGIFYHYILGKLGASLAAIDPLKRGRAMCEIFGAYGWEEGVKLEKYLVDHFLVRGINHYVPHAFSAKEFPDPDCPPHFYAHGHNPQYRHFGALMQYTNRMCEILNDGHRVVPAAILYNAEAEWTGEYKEFEETAVRLTDRQIDFDIIPADVFQERDKYQTEFGKTLKVNRQEYKVLIIPETQFITAEVATAIPILHKFGCQVLFINSYPEGVCNGDDTLLKYIGGCKVVRPDELIRELDNRQVPEIALIPSDDRIRYLHYRGESDCYLFINEGTKRYEGTIRVPENGSCYQYNAWENQIEMIPYVNDTEVTSLTVCMEPGKSLMVVFDEAATEVMKEPVAVSSKRTPWNENWRRSICRSAEYPQFKSETMISLPDNLAEERPEFSGVIRYEKELVCGETPKSLALEISEAYEGVEVFVNQISAGIQIVKPFQYDITGLLKTGQNLIRVEVATTLERELAKLPDPVRMYMGLGEKIPECPSGISGTIDLINL